MTNPTANHVEQSADDPRLTLRIDKAATEAMGVIAAEGDLELAAGARDGAVCRATGSIVVGGPIGACELSAGRDDAMDYLAGEAARAAALVLDSMTTPDHPDPDRASSAAARLAESAARLCDLLEPGRRASIRASSTIQSGATIAGQGWSATFRDELVGPLEIIQSDSGDPIVRRPDGETGPLSDLADVTRDDPSPATLRSALEALRAELDGRSRAA